MKQKTWSIQLDINNGEYDVYVSVTGYSLVKISSRHIDVDGVSMQFDTDIVKIKRSKKSLS